MPDAMHALELHMYSTYVPFTGPPDGFIPSEENALAWYRSASIHSFTDADYGFAKAVSCLRLISVFKV